MIVITPPHKLEIEDKIIKYGDTLISSNYTYISSPITTGIKLLNLINLDHKQSLLLKDEYFNDEYKEIVIEQNIQSIRNFKIKNKLTETGGIIDPSGFEESEWSQIDYLFFWGEIIKKYVNKIIFLNEWYYSRGCIYEFYLGLKKDIKLVNENFIDLNNKDCLLCIQQAMDQYKRNKLDTSLQETILKEIENIIC